MSRFAYFACLCLMAAVGFCEDDLPPRALSDKFTEAGSSKFASDIAYDHVLMSPEERGHLLTYIKSREITDSHYGNLIYLLCVSNKDVKECSKEVIKHSKRLEEILATGATNETWDLCMFCLAQAFEAPDGGAALEKRVCTSIGGLSPDRQITTIDTMASTRWVDSQTRMANLKSIYSNESVTHAARVAILEAICAAGVQRRILPIQCLSFYTELADLPEHSPSLTKQMLARLMFLIRLK